MNIRYIKGQIKGRIKKYWEISVLFFREFYYNNRVNLVFIAKKYFKKGKVKVSISDSRINDYAKDLVTIGILTKNRLDLIRPCLNSILENPSGGKHEAEILIGDTGSGEEKVWNFYKDICEKYKNVKIVKFKKYYFSRNYNELFGRYASGQYLIFLNNDTIVKGNWIDSLTDPLRDKKIGIVGGKLLNADGTIQHAGIVFDENGNSVNLYHGMPKNLREADFKATVPGVTFACAAVRRDIFFRFWINEEYKEEAQDTDFCLRLLESGFTILYNPEVEIYHFECSSRDWRKGEKDRRLMKKQWGKKIIEFAGKKNQRIYLK